MSTVNGLEGLIAPHSTDELDYARAFGEAVFGPLALDDGNQWSIHDDYWSMDGVLVVSNGKDSFAVEPQGNGVKRVVFDERGILLGLSAHAFRSPEQEVQEIVNF